jgi:hypothetical protein
MHKKFVPLIAAALVALAAAFAAPVASADVTRSGKVFTASPAYCSCWTTQSGYEFVGIPFSEAQRDGFLSYLHLGSDVPTVFGGQNADGSWHNGLMDELRADPSFEPGLPAVTSGSVQTTVSGTVEDGDTPVDDGDGLRSSWGHPSAPGSPFAP